MFAKAAFSTTLLALAVVTAATIPASQCNTGNLQCCNTTTNATTPAVTRLADLFGISASSIAAPIGIICSPIHIKEGVDSGASCSSQPVCCSNNSFNNFIAFGCSAVDLSL